MIKKIKTLAQSMEFINGDPDILPYSLIRDQVSNRPSYAAGQIKKDSIFGKELHRLALNTKYKSYLDIGTWCGLGTTKCFLDGIITRQDDSCLYALETNKRFYDITNQYWNKYFEVYNIDKTKFRLF